MADEIQQKDAQQPDEKLLADVKPQDLETKLAECEKKCEEYLAGWQRAKADFSNYKKDEALRFQEIVRYANEEIIGDLIKALDSFDLGIAALEKAGPVEKGIYMIRVQIEDILKQYGLERIAVKIGDQPNTAMAEVVGEAESDAAPGTIVEEIERGYKVGGRVLRPARVKVAKGKGLSG